MNCEHRLLLLRASRLLQRWGKDDPEILCESLDAAYHEADRMSIMVNDMLDMVRVQGSFDLHKGEITDLKQSIDLVLGISESCILIFVSL